MQQKKMDEMGQCKNDLIFIFFLKSFHFNYFCRFTFTTEKDDVKAIKKLTGSMRVGALSKGLLLVNENEVDLVIICSVPPSVALFNSIVTVLPEKFKVI